MVGIADSAPFCGLFFGRRISDFACISPRGGGGLGAASRRCIDIRRLTWVVAFSVVVIVAIVDVVIVVAALFVDSPVG